MSPFSLSLPVRRFVSFETLLTCVPHHLESIFLPTKLSALLGMLPGNFIHLGTEPSLGCPIIEVSSYSVEMRRANICHVSLHDFDKCISVHIDPSLYISPSPPVLSPRPSHL